MTATEKLDYTEQLMKYVDNFRKQLALTDPFRRPLFDLWGTLNYHLEKLKADAWDEERGK